MHPLYLIAIGFPTGVLVGLTGIGGAALMTPVLILVLGVAPELAVGTDLVYATVTKTVGAAVHWRLGHVDLRVVGQLASASLPAGAAGVFLAVRLGETQGVLKAVIGVALILAAIALSIQRAPTDSSDPRWSPSVPRIRIATLACGAVVGFLVGLTSIGSGSLVLPFLILIRHLPTARAVGSDVLHAAILVGFTALLHAQFGGVQWRLLPWLLAGSIPGAMLGSVMTKWLPRATLRPLLTVLILVSAVKLLGLV